MTQLKFKNNFIGLAVVFLAGLVIGIFIGKGSISQWLNPAESSKIVYQYSFAGEGIDTVGPFALADGLVFINIKNQAGPNDYLGANFYFDKDGDGKRGDGDEWLDQLINVGYGDAEAFDGTIPMKVSAGNHFIDIDGARWQIEVMQPALSDQPAKQFSSAKGRGPQVTEMFYLDQGEYKFRATNNGSSNFIVYLVDNRGNYSRRLVNEIGEFDSDFTVKVVMPGNYLFYVYSNGDWQIEPAAE